MPYIDKFQRKFFYIPIEVATSLHKAGQLNYLFTQICLAYLENEGVAYQTYNDVIGALECCKQELYRKQIAQYEDKKEEMNGTVWPK